MSRPRVPPGFRAIGEAEAKRILQAGTPGLMAMYIGHDDSCPGAHGKPSECNCNPSVEYYRVATLPRKGGAR